MATLYLRPSAVGDETALTPYPGIGEANWQDVDEASPDEDATYVKAESGFNKRDLYGLGDTSQTGTINWIKVWIRARKFGTGYGYTAIKTGGTAYEGSQNTLTDAYANYSTQYTTNPQAGGAWTWTQLNALQAGVRLLGGGAKAEEAFCTQVYIEVDYTAIVAPTVTTQDVTDIAPTTATGNGNITATGGENCTKRGICWNTTGSPTVADSKTEESGSFGTGAFTEAMTGLSPGTLYYVKAYAYNSAGYGYGAQVTFIAPTLLKLKMIPKRPWNRMSRLYKSLSLKGG